MLYTHMLYIYIYTTSFIYVLCYIYIYIYIIYYTYLYCVYKVYLNFLGQRFNRSKHLSFPLALSALRLMYPNYTDVEQSLGL